VAGSLWWNWSPASDNLALIERRAVQWIRCWAVYTGSSVATLNPSGVANDVGQSKQPYVTFAAKRRTYRIAVASVDTNSLDRSFANRAWRTTRHPIPTISISSPPAVCFRIQANYGCRHCSDPLPNASGVKEVLVKVMVSFAILPAERPIGPLHCIATGT